MELALTYVILSHDTTNRIWIHRNFMYYHIVTRHRILNICTELNNLKEADTLLAKKTFRLCLVQGPKKKENNLPQLAGSEKSTCWILNMRVSKCQNDVATHKPLKRPRIGYK